MFLLKPMHSYQPLHGGNLEIFFIRLVIKSLNTLRWPEFLHRLKFSRWNQSLCSSLSYRIPSGVYFYIICPIYGPGCFPYTCGQSHRWCSQYRDIGFASASANLSCMKNSLSCIVDIGQMYFVLLASGLVNGNEAFPYRNFTFLPVRVIFDTRRLNFFR